ncbi:hypothetical protein GQ53DRAFT_690656 [Thozetella sp. PMI_491]|nr:hypothetical protein GQ53DRAFT_690656 [Thozetella sp. PMI_491]
MPQGTIDPSLLFFGMMDPYFDMTLDYGSDYEHGNENFALAPMMAPSDDLATRVQLLKAELEQWAASSQIDFSQGYFQEFFTDTKFYQLLMVFFRRRQLLAQVIHWPTFDPSKVDLGLLLALGLAGAVYSHYIEKTLEISPDTTVLQDLAENYIFRRLTQFTASAGSSLALELCQAAYLILELQVCDNDVITRRRSIVKRHPVLVDALRKMGMTGSAFYSTELNTDWSSFVYRECCTRLVTWISLNDGLYALFCGTPPCMTVSELSGPFLCRESLWNADSLENFKTARDVEDPDPEHHCTRELIASLLEDEWTEARETSFGKLDVLPLFIAIVVFQGIIFNHRSSMLPTCHAAILLRALDRWNRLWGTAISLAPADRQRWMGVAKHAPEFALISRRILEVGATEEGKRSRYLRCTAEYDFTAFREFIIQHGLAARSTPLELAGS